MHIAWRAQSSHKLLRYQLKSTLAQMSAINVQEFVAVPNLQTNSGWHITSLGRCMLLRLLRQSVGDGLRWNFRQ